MLHFKFITVHWNQPPPQHRLECQGGQNKSPLSPGGLGKIYHQRRLLVYQISLHRIKYVAVISVSFQTARFIALITLYRAFMRVKKSLFSPEIFTVPSECFTLQSPILHDTPTFSCPNFKSKHKLFSNYSVRIMIIPL